MTDVPDPEGVGRPPSSGDRAEGDPRALSARDLQSNPGQDALETQPGSDADQANQVPHVG